MDLGKRNILWKQHIVLLNNYVLWGVEHRRAEGNPVLLKVVLEGNNHQKTWKATMCLSWLIIISLFRKYHSQTILNYGVMLHRVTIIQHVRQVRHIFSFWAASLCILLIVTAISWPSCHVWSVKDAKEQDHTGKVRRHRTKLRASSSLVGGKDNLWIWLVNGFNPLKNMSSSIGMSIPNWMGK